MNCRLQAELNAVRRLRRIARRRRRSRSRLDRYRAELESLAAAGASSNDLAVWLRRFKRVHVHPTTVWRALRRWRQDAS